MPSAIALAILCWPRLEARNAPSVRLVANPVSTRMAGRRGVDGWPARRPPPARARRPQPPEMEEGVGCARGGGGAGPRRGPAPKRPSDGRRVVFPRGVSGKIAPGLPGADPAVTGIDHDGV